LKMELTEGSETSANHNLTRGKYPKEHIQYSKHGESLKSRINGSYRLYGIHICALCALINSQAYTTKCNVLQHNVFTIKTLAL
jgi:hypothetical protein